MTIWSFLVRAQKGNCVVCCRNFIIVPLGVLFYCLHGERRNFKDTNLCVSQKSTLLELEWPVTVGLW